MSVRRAQWVLSQQQHFPEYLCDSNTRLPQPPAASGASLRPPVGRSGHSKARSPGAHDPAASAFSLRLCLCFWLHWPFAAARGLS